MLVVVVVMVVEGDGWLRSFSSLSSAMSPGTVACKSTLSRNAQRGKFQGYVLYASQMLEG